MSKFFSTFFLDSANPGCSWRERNGRYATITSFTLISTVTLPFQLFSSSSAMRCTAFDAWITSWNSPNPNAFEATHVFDILNLRCFWSFPRYSRPDVETFSIINTGFGFPSQNGLNAEMARINFRSIHSSGKIASTLIVLVIGRSWAMLAAPSSISRQKTSKCSFNIVNPAACLWPQNATKYCLYFSRKPTILKYSGLRQLATSRSPSSFRAIVGLWWASQRRPAMSPMIPCSISVES